MRQFKINQAINHIQFVIYWYKSNNVGFIKKYSYFAKLWPKNGTNAHIWAYGLKIFMGTQETIIYRLVVWNPSYDAYFSVLIFLGHLLRGNGHQARPFWFGASKPDQKVRQLGGPLAKSTLNRYLEVMFLKFSGVNPLKLKSTATYAKIGCNSLQNINRPKC